MTGIFFRVNRNGWDNVEFEDLKPDELKAILENHSSEFLISLILQCQKYVRLHAYAVSQCMKLAGFRQEHEAELDELTSIRERIEFALRSQDVSTFEQTLEDIERLLVDAVGMTYINENRVEFKDEG